MLRVFGETSTNLLNARKVFHKNYCWDQMLIKAVGMDQILTKFSKDKEVIIFSLLQI